MKRMLVAGAPSIYSIGPVFRAEESGDFHNIEFTMMEWYEVGADMDTGIALLGDLATEVIGSTGFQRATYREVFTDHLKIDPISSNADEIHSLVSQVDPSLVNAEQLDRDDCLNLLLSELIQPHLGQDRPIIVTDYPISQAALAKPSVSDPHCAARFELFSNGIELANGYDELLDREVLIDRARQSNHKRTASGREILPENTLLAQAMNQDLPPCAGVALGVDRLLMICTGATSIDQVMPFTISIA
jgi:lysyl-tRNA synthetase class 2